MDKSWPALHGLVLGSPPRRSLRIPEQSDQLNPSLSDRSGTTSSRRADRAVCMRSASRYIVDNSRRAPRAKWDTDIAAKGAADG